MSSVSLERNPQNIKALKHIYKATLWIEKVCYFYLSIRKKKVCFKTLFGNIGNKLKATLKKKNHVVLCAFAKKFQIQFSNLHFDCLK